MSHIIAKLVVWALRHNLKLSDKILVTNALLDNLGAIPVRAIISFKEDGTLLINGKPLELEQAIQLRESAKQLLHSQARRLIGEQVKWKAIELAVHNGTSPETILFAKAALWLQSELDKVINQIAQEDSELLG
jgi:hypothetical protein